MKPPDQQKNGRARPKPEPKPKGPPSDYTDEIGAEIIECRRLGMSRNAAADYVGVAESTVRDWEKKHPAFRTACARARAEIVREAAEVFRERLENDDLRAAELILKTHDRASWSERHDLTIEPEQSTEEKAREWNDAIRVYSLKAKMLSGLCPTPEAEAEVLREIEAIEKGECPDEVGTAALALHFLENESNDRIRRRSRG